MYTALTFFGCSVTYLCLYNYCCRLIGELCNCKRLAYGIDVISVRDRYNLPSACGKSRGYVLVERKLCASFDRYLISVVNQCEFIELERACKRYGFISYTLHKASVSAQHVGTIVEHIETVNVILCSHMGLGNRHAYCHCNSLSEGACCGFDAGCMLVFGMSRCLASPLTELLNVVHADTVAVKMEHCIFQH